MDMHTVLVPVGADLYAIPIDWVREVVAAPGLTPLVTAPPVVLGLFNLRGEIVPLLDTAALLGLSRIDEVSFAVVLRTPDGPIGLGATGFPERAMLEAPLGPSELPGTTGTYRVDHRVAVLFDIAALLVSDRIGATDPRALALPVGHS